MNREFNLYQNSYCWHLMLCLHNVDTLNTCVKKFEVFFLISLLLLIIDCVYICCRHGEYLKSDPLQATSNFGPQLLRLLHIMDKVELAHSLFFIGEVRPIATSVPS